MQLARGFLLLGLGRVLEARVHRVLKRLLHIENGLSKSRHDILILRSFRVDILVCCLVSPLVLGLVCRLIEVLPKVFGVINRLVDIGVNVLASYAPQIDDFTLVLSILLILVHLINIDCEQVASSAVFNSPLLVDRI